ncbi:MAG: hypothetical protein WD851_19295 [Pirellulales bacterium]
MIVTSPTPARPAKSRSRKQLYVVGVVLVALALGLAWAARDLFSEGDSAAISATPVKAPALSNSAKPQALGPVVAESPLIEDDGRTLWASPTQGEPLDLRYLPPGCSLILALRPSDLLAHPEAEKLLAALGPRGTEIVSQLEKILGSELSQVEQLLVGVRASADQSLDVCLVARFPEAQQRGAESGEWAVYSPPGASGRTLVFVRKETLREVEEQGAGLPLLRRELELLADSTDGNRQVTLLVAPNFLFADGKAILSGLASPLREPLFDQLRDELRAVSASANWDDDFFVELRAVSTSDLTPTQLSVQLAEQVARWPQQVEDAVLVLAVDPHGRRVVARLPAMMRVLANYTRAGTHEDQAVLRAYLPLAAGHNLLMAAELLLAQQAAGPRVDVGTVAIAPAKPASVVDRLQKRTTLRFDRDTLEAALRLLSEDIGVEIVLAGGDLQLEGITKNQSFGIDLGDEPAEKILQEIVRLANPDKTATSLSDTKQKLVYVVKPKEPGGEDVIFVTTRSQAAGRGEELPAVFRPPAP